VAAHAPLPQVGDLGGPVLAAPKILPIVYGGDPDTATIQAFLTSLTGGSYWHATTAEYGVGPLSILPAVTLASPTQASISDAALQSLIALNTGSSGSWGSPDPSTIYLFVLPPGLVATDQGSACCTDFGGYHGEANVAGTPVPYAVSCACPGYLGPGWDPLDERTGAMSHEIIEAATDPFPLSDPALQQADQANLVWTLVAQGELGDMCAVQPDAFIVSPDARFAVQRSWSNAAALAGQSPCVPAPTSVPYFNSMPVLDLVAIGSGGYETRAVQIPVGQTRTVAVNLFSVGPIAHDWTVQAYSYEQFHGAGTPSLSFSFDRSSGRNGDVLHLAITALSTNAQLQADPFILLSTYGSPGDPDYQTNIAMGLVLN
jgi:hypothetical protein